MPATPAPAAAPAPAAPHGLAPERIVARLRDTLERAVLDADVAFGQATVTLAPAELPRAARICKSDPDLHCDFFDFLTGVDLGDEGFAVVVRLYSTTLRHAVHLRVAVPGGREAPVVPTITGVYRGANWHERETYDMFGIAFEGHPGLLPRILTVENFEGWPLRKEFRLTTRDAKPWPGAKEPEERTEAEPVEAPPIELRGGKVVQPGDAAPGTGGATAATAAAAAPAAPQREEVEYDQAVFDQLIAEGKSERMARAKAKAAAMRARKANVGPDPSASGQERASAGDPAPQTPEGAAEIAVTQEADPSIAKDAAAGAVGGDVAAGAPGDVAGSDQPVNDPAQEAAVGDGAAPVAGGTPGVEAEGRHGGAGPDSDDEEGDR